MNESLTSALMQLALAAMTVATLLLTTFVVPWLRAHVSARNWATATNMAASAVRTVEQKQEASPATDKYAFAAARLRTLAASKGIKLSDTDVQTLIEASVNDLRVTLAAVNAPPLPALTPEDKLAALVPRVDYSTVGAATKPVRKTAPKAKVAKETTV